MVTYEDLCWHDVLTQIEYVCERILILGTDTEWLPYRYELQGVWIEKKNQLCRRLAELEQDYLNVQPD